MGIYRVIGYNEGFNVHECKNHEGGGTEYFDLFVSGCFPEDTTVEDLIGKDINIQDAHPFIKIADSVSILKKDKYVHEYRRQLDKETGGMP